MMSDNSVNNKRIAKNTVFLYIRMIVVMLVNLYASRVILSQLGVVDYGIYNVVGGVVAMFGFLNSSMTTATQRFLTFELGKGDVNKLKRVFACSLNIHIGLGVVIVLLAETVGLWMVNTQLVIPEERVLAANVVYQVAILSFFLNMIQVPYNAAIIAHERMNVYAYISFLDAGLKLAAVYALVLVNYDKLIAYAIFTFIAVNLIRYIYQVYCRKHFQETFFLLFWDKQLYKTMIGFAGWNIFGSLAWMFRGQGVSILINMFFGPAINAAQAVATQVNTAIMHFVSSFLSAVNPQVTKNYAQGNITQMENLVYTATRLSFLLLLTITLPILFNIDFILHLWLEVVPDMAGIFIILIMADQLINLLLSPLFITSLMATGKIEKYQVCVSIIIMLVIPISYVLLKNGGRPESIYYVMLFLTPISGLARFYFCKKQIGFSFKRLLKNTLIPTLFTAVIAISICWYVNSVFFSSDTTKCFILSFISTAVITLVVAILAGVKMSEKRIAVSIVKAKLHRS